MPVRQLLIRDDANVPAGIALRPGDVRDVVEATLQAVSLGWETAGLDGAPVDPSSVSAYDAGLAYGAGALVLDAGVVYRAHAAAAAGLGPADGEPWRVYARVTATITSRYSDCSGGFWETQKCIHTSNVS